MGERERMATAFRDFIHEQPFSQCGMGVDTCQDWPLAYELADIALDALRSERPQGHHCLRPLKSDEAVREDNG